MKTIFCKNQLNPFKIFCLHNTVTWRLEAGIVKSEKTTIAKQRLVETRFRDNQLEQSVDKKRLSKHYVSVTTASWNMFSWQRRITEEWTVYLRCAWSQLRPWYRIQRYSSREESERVKYGRESHGIRTREWMRWGEPAAIVNDTHPLVRENVI
jgi:hypothetical protein